MNHKIIVDGSKVLKWTVYKCQSRRSKTTKVDSQNFKGLMKTLMSKSERYKNLQVGYQIIERYNFTFYQLSFWTPYQSDRLSRKFMANMTVIDDQNVSYPYPNLQVTLTLIWKLALP